MVTDGYAGTIREYFIELERYINGTTVRAKKQHGSRKYDPNDDETILRLLRALQEMYKIEIHANLVPKTTFGRVNDNENTIRTYIKTIIKDILPYLERKLEFIRNRIKTIDKKTPKVRYSDENVSLRAQLNDKLGRYFELYDDFYALAAFRSFKHYCLYMEWDAPYDKKIWCHSDKLAAGIWFCFGDMALNGGYKNLFKQTPTGYFKTWSNLCFIAWLLGLDKNQDCLYMVGNPTMISRVILGVVNQMCKKRFAKIFPQYSEFGCDPNKMFTINSTKNGELLISGATVTANLICASKDTAIDGVRFKWRFYDDITRSKQKHNAEAHANDLAMYHDDWSKRRYTEFNDYEIFSGTAYDAYDMISQLKEEKGVDKAEKGSFPYTTVNKSTKTMFVKIPKLDYETDLSTLPERYTTETARNERQRDYETFMAMEQQEPIPPTGLPFEWRRIRTYDTLPAKGLDGGRRSDYCKAVCDPARVGDNNLSLGIHSQLDDDWYLVDCFYMKIPLDGKMQDGRTALDHICDKIISHKVNELLIEVNTVSNFKKQIDDILKARGYRLCKIDELYSTQKKSQKIMDNQTAITEHIIFPKRGMYGDNSMMGQYMKDIVTWNVKAKSDDSPDCEAMFAAKFISNAQGNYGTVMTFAR